MQAELSWSGLDSALSLSGIAIMDFYQITIETKIVKIKFIMTFRSYGYGSFYHVYGYN